MLHDFQPSYVLGFSVSLDNLLCVLTTNDWSFMSHHCMTLFSIYELCQNISQRLAAILELYIHLLPNYW